MWLAYANVKVNASGVGKGVKCKKWVYSYFKVSFPFGWTLALFYCFIKIILWLMYLYFFFSFWLFHYYRLLPYMELLGQ